MAELIEIDDPADPRLADYRDLRDVQLRQTLEVEHGLFLAEGEKVVRRAVAGGFAARTTATPKLRAGPRGRASTTARATPAAAAPPASVAATAYLLNRWAETHPSTLAIATDLDHLSATSPATGQWPLELERRAE